MEKRELRKHYLALRAAVEDRQAKDAAICRNLRSLECCCNASALALYVTDGKARRRLESGDRIMEYLLYNGEDLLRALARGGL